VSVGALVVLFVVRLFSRALSRQQGSLVGLFCGSRARFQHLQINLPLPFHLIRGPQHQHALAGAFSPPFPPHPSTASTTRILLSSNPPGPTTTPRSPPRRRLGGQSAASTVVLRRQGQDARVGEGGEGGEGGGSNACDEITEALEQPRPAPRSLFSRALLPVAGSLAGLFCCTCCAHALRARSGCCGAAPGPAPSARTTAAGALLHLHHLHRLLPPHCHCRQLLPPALQENDSDPPPPRAPAQAAASAGPPAPRASRGGRNLPPHRRRRDGRLGASARPRPAPPSPAIPPPSGGGTLYLSGLFAGSRTVY